MGQRLMDHTRQLAARRQIAVQVTGFGAAFAVHFTKRAALHEYRDLFDDDVARLRQFLQLGLEEGLHIVPDGRFYVSAAHTERDIEETSARLEQVFARMQ
jgi:glutamate-1-semialdehyde 2,1-aminomutase